MECQSKWNFTSNGMSLQMEFHLKLNVTQNGMSFKMERHSKDKRQKMMTELGENASVYMLLP